MTWVVLNGEDSGHKCDLPWSVGEPGMGAIHLQKRHAGSVWKCECGRLHEWSGRKWKDVNYAMGR
jgi:hypothetical protein